MSIQDCDVVVVGGGPAGLTAALGLARRGRTVVVVDEGLDHTVGSRAPMVHAGTLRVLEELGCVDDVLAASIRGTGLEIRSRRRRLLRSPMDGVPGKYQFQAMLPQHGTESILRAHAEVAGARFVIGRARGLTQDDDGVRVQLDGGGEVVARYAIAADGVRSTIREAVGVDFPDSGSQRTDDEKMLIADVTPTGDHSPDRVVAVLGDGPMVLIPMPGDRMRIILSAGEEPGTADADVLRREVERRRPRAAEPLDFTEIHWISRFRFRHHLAETFRAGRVLLVGDAAHVHSPAGGQGMNLGIRDAYYAAESLDAVLDGSPDATLDAYAANRRVAAQGVIALTNRLTRMLFAPPPARPIRNAVMRLVDRTPAPAKQALAMSGVLDVGPDLTRTLVPGAEVASR